MSATESPVWKAPSVGDVLVGKYRLDRVLGEGGMGTVFAAFHLQLGELVAVKVLKSERAPTPKLGQRLLREARAAVRLKSDHVVRIQDVGALEDEQPFIVMEHLQGQDLAKLLRHRGPLPVQQAVDYVLQACEAIAEAHAAGIVHRDLKPANLFLQQVAGIERIKVLDFGISRALEGAGPDAQFMTSAHALVGSPAYASPEQLATPELVELRTDIWALGVVSYELLTGKTPFAAGSLALVCTRILKEEPTPLRTLRKDVPAALEQVIHKALRKPAAGRQQTILELARELAPLGSAESLSSLQRVEAFSGHSKVFDSEPDASRWEGDLSGATVTAPGSESGFRPLTVRRLRKLLGSTLPVVVGLAAASYFWISRRAPATPAVGASGHAASAPAPAPALDDHPSGPAATTVAPTPSLTTVNPTAKPLPQIPIRKLPLAHGATPAKEERPLLASPPPSGAMIPANEDPYLHRK